MIATAERLIQKITPRYQAGTVRLMVVLENPRAILRTHEIMDALYPYFAGASLGWHDYLGSTARLFKEDGNYRIPVKADPDIVIKYIQASHRIVADVVGSRGGIKIGGMYGILPVTTDLKSTSFQVTLLGYFKDVITQMKRGLTGFWVAHPDFVRLGLALVQAWRMREQGQPEALRRLCQEMLLEPYCGEIDRFIEGADIVGLDPGAPGYVRSLLVADLRESDTIPNHDLEEVRYNVFQSLQYLVDWLSGNGCVALPALVRDTPVRVMDDLATAERSRWEVWAEIHHGRVSKDQFLRIAFEELQFIRKDLSNDKKIVQVKWNSRTEKWYPVAFRLMIQLMTAENPPEFATELLLPFTTDSIRDSSDPLGALRKIDPNHFALNPWIERFCHYFEACGSARFAREMADLPFFDSEAVKKCILSFSLSEVLEAASFHGDIGEPKKSLDAKAATEQAGVSESELETNRELQTLGSEYLKKFGFKFLISARGRTGAELLLALKERLRSTSEQELSSAREALFEIALKRLSLSPIDTVLSQLESIRARHGVQAAGLAVLNAGKIQSIGLNTPAHTSFELASLSKTMASAFAMEFFSARKIPLSTSVNSLLERAGSPFRLKAADPGIDPNDVNLAHLMSHQALNQHYVRGFEQTKKMPPLLDLIQGTGEARAFNYQGIQVISRPGTRFSYSGGGFLVLEHLIELLSKKSGSECLSEFLSAMDAKDAKALMADGFFDSGEKVPGGRLNFPVFAAGALGTASEMAQVLLHLERAHSRLEGSGGISHDTAAQMLHAKDLGCQQFMGCDVGVGVFVIEAGENRLMLHQGSNEGFRALFLHCFSGPDQGKGFVILCNADNKGVTFVAEIAQVLLRGLHFSGIDFEKFTTQLDFSRIPQEQKVNLGYRDLIFRAFLPQLPDAIETPGEKDPLASANLAVGAQILRVSNQRFARAENLISTFLPTFDPKLYCKQGKVMDSWESARHNPEEFDFLELRLRKASRVRFISLSTEFHDGNHPEAARLFGRASGSTEWTEFLPKTSLKGHSLLRLDLGRESELFEEIRVEMFPDGGLSRLGLFAELPASVAKDFQLSGKAQGIRFAHPIPKPSKPLAIPYTPDFQPKNAPGSAGTDWASLAYGGQVAGVTNEHYGPAHQVISPYPPIHMFDGFESARSRRAGHFETLEIQLGNRIHVESIVLDFEHYVNNNPSSIRVLAWENESWRQIVPKTEVKAFAANKKEFRVAGEKAITTRLKFEIFPDGGINRVHVFGPPTSRAPGTSGETSRALLR
ncbi:MAG: serine hydrolase, partial [Bdellovibrionales bacterium]|nr:serine hydrolase [Bdellovibrionales bacterium]